MTPDLKELFRKYINRTASDQEVRQFLLLLQDKNLKAEVEQIVEEYYEELPKEYILSEVTAHRIFSNIIVPVQKRKRFGWRQLTAAAAVLFIMVGTVYYFWLSQRMPDDVLVVAQQDVAAPDKNRSYLILDNNQVIYLDSVSGGVLYEEEGLRVIKTEDGKILYEGNTRDAKLLQNTLNNPKGSKVIDIGLSDGSHVWLNAGSSLTYPLSFAGNERRVTVSGEAYFDVQSDIQNPFYVNYQYPFNNETGEVKVTGTEFNVLAYPGETNAKVTLLNGKVQVKQFSGNEYKTIQPSEQASLSKDGIIVNTDVDLESVVAWKNGFFQFKNSSIETIMKEISRWYDAEIKYEGNIKGEFYAEISRDVPVSKLLKMLELTGRVHFEIKEKTIIVKP